MARDQSANANQTERRRRHQSGKAVQPGIISASRHQLKKNAAATQAASAVLQEQFGSRSGNFEFEVNGLLVAITDSNFLRFGAHLADLLVERLDRVFTCGQIGDFEG